MSKGNLYEDATAEVAAWMPGIIEAAAKEVRGGKTPPWKTQLTGLKLIEYYQSMPPDKKGQLLSTLSPRDQQMIRDYYDRTPSWPTNGAAGAGDAQELL